jgi:hypothetical protein
MKEAYSANFCRPVFPRRIRNLKIVMIDGSTSGHVLHGQAFRIQQDIQGLTPTPLMCIMVAVLNY